MAAAVIDFPIQQGETWSRVITWQDPDGTPIDLSTHTGRMQVRLGYDTPVVLELSTSPETGQGSIVLGGTAGTITLSLTAAQTASLALLGAPSGSIKEGDDLIQGKLALYDLQLDSGGVVTVLCRGQVCLVREVTR